MKKILLITQMFPPMLGGAANYYYKLCDNLPSDKILVLADNKWEDNKDLTTHRFKFKVYFRSFFYTSKYIWPKWLKLFFLIKKIIKTDKPELLWAGEVLPAGIVVLLISKIYKIPYFVSTHGADVLNPLYKTGSKGKWKQILVRIILNKAAFVTANAEYTRLIVSKLGIKRSKTTTIYPAAINKPPVPIKFESKNISKIKMLKDEDFTILFTAVGHLVNRKGIDKVIQALPEVWQEKPKLAYIITGTGTYKNKLEEMAKLKDKFVDNRSRIYFTGPISDNELKVLYDLCDIYIMVPRIINGLAEGFGIVYLEAGYFGKPVIGSKITGIPEAIRELNEGNYSEATGLLVKNTNNEREVAKKILMLVKDKGLAKKLGDNNKLWAKNFSYEKGAKILIERINSL